MADRTIGIYIRFSRAFLGVVFLQLSLSHDINIIALLTTMGRSIELNQSWYVELLENSMSQMKSALALSRN